MNVPEAQHHDIQASLDALFRLLSAQTDTEPLDGLPPRQRGRLRKSVLQMIDTLHQYAAKLDTIRDPSYVFDPMDPKNIGKLIADTLLNQPRIPLVDLPRFYGAGVYALYYRGGFDAYQMLSGKDYPLYIGKADPNDKDAISPRKQGDRLWKRLIKEHANSIREVNNLEVEDFDCRYLVIMNRWHKTAEDYLISRFKPIWNSETKVCYGISKHGDDPKTRQNSRSPWDTLHPGRSWAWSAGNRANKYTAQEIAERVIKHLHNTVI